METSKIRIFKNYPLLSKLMPYYGSSPEGFLLLSLLSKSVRGYLLEHYPEYRTFMLEYTKMIKYVKDGHLEMKLPLDLFKFSALNVDSDDTAEFLVDLICSLTNKEGLYFGEHYMSDQICFEKIYVWPEYIPTLHPHIESLRSIKVFPIGGQDLSLHHSFLDLIVLRDIFDWRDQLKACFFIDSELEEINPIYESFKKIKEVYLGNYEEAIEKLNMLKQTSIQEIEYIRIDDLNVLEDKEITNLLLNYNIITSDYSKIDNCESISNLALENISKINPQELYLPYLKSISSLSRIFLHLREDINVSFGRGSVFYPLKFEKTLVIFKTKDDMVKAYCDNIGFSFDENCSQENILFLENYVCISNFEETSVQNFKKENLTTQTPLEGLSLSDLKNESCILIPKNSLSCIRLNLGDMSYIFENEINGTNFKSLSLKTKIIIKLSSMKDLAELNKLKEYFQEHSELVISYDPSGINSTNFDETLLSAILSKFKLTSLEVDCDGTDEDIFMQLLQMPSIQDTLEHFRIDELHFFKCTTVFELLVEFKRIKAIKMRLYYSKNDENDELEEWKLKIEQFETKLKKKHSEIEIDINYLKI